MRAVCSCAKPCSVRRRREADAGGARLRRSAAARHQHLCLWRRLEPRIALPRMLLDNFPPMTEAASPNRVGFVDGGKNQFERAARGDVSGDGALPIGQTGGEGADPRRAVRDDGQASQASGARAPATRDGWAGRGRGTTRAQTQTWRDDKGRAGGSVGGVRSGVRQWLKVMIQTLLPALEQHGRLRLGHAGRYVAHSSGACCCVFDL
jgi:hypothetical protein